MFPGKLNSKPSILSDGDIKDSSKRKRGTNTLFSTGILDKKKAKHNEYFGGDSTVVLGGTEDENSDSTRNNSSDSRPIRKLNKSKK